MCDASRLVYLVLTREGMFYEPRRETFDTNPVVIIYFSKNIKSYANSFELEKKKCQKNPQAPPPLVIFNNIYFFFWFGSRSRECSRWPRVVSFCGTSTQFQGGEREGGKSRPWGKRFRIWMLVYDTSSGPPQRGRETLSLHGRESFL